MNIFFPFCEKDHDRAIQWMEWVGEITHPNKQKHTIYLHPAAKIKDFSRIKALAEAAFETVMVEPDREGHEGWPQGPNSAFRQAAWLFYQKEDWMYCEPDTCLMTVDGFDRIEASHKASGKAFTGDIAPAGNGYGQHMSGNGVYSANTPDFVPVAMTAHHVPFDIAQPAPIVANLNVTPLIQHCFEYPAGQQPAFPTQESLSLIRDDAVFFHRAKGMDLIERLRERRSEKPAPVAEQPAAPIVVASSAPNSHVVYTYYDYVPEMPSQEWMLQTWANRWEKAGFTPIVLSRKSAETHKNFKHLESYFKSLPTINPPGYELSCWLRWIAMCQVGGGTMVDYDVLPYGFNSGNVDNLAHITSEWSLPAILHTASPCPCAVYGTAKQYNTALGWFLDNRDKCIKTEQGRLHASDQVAVQSGPPWIASDICRQYGGENWQSATLLHYCHAACAGRPREQVIPEAEKLRNAASTPVAPASAKPATWIDRVRDAVFFLQAESKLSDNNRTRIMTVLKQNGLAVGGIKFAPERTKKKAMRRKPQKQTVKV